MLGGMQREQVDWRKLLWVGALVIVLSAVANVVVYFIASALNIITPAIIVPAVNQPIGVGAVIGSTVAQVFAGVLVFALLARFTKRPISLFRIVAIIALVLSFALPLTIAGVPTSFKLALEAMHVVAGVITIGLLTTMVRRQ